MPRKGAIKASGSERGRGSLAVKFQSPGKRPVSGEKKKGGLGARGIGLLFAVTTGK